MTWAIHHIALRADDLSRGEWFFGEVVGLGAPERWSGSAGERRSCFGTAGRGVHLVEPRPALADIEGQILGPVEGRHVALTVADLDPIRERLARANAAFVDDHGGDRRGVYCLDPALNLVAFLEAAPGDLDGDDAQPWEAAQGWGVHHVNLEARDVRTAVAFYVDLAGLDEGRWQAPADMGDFSIDPSELAVLPLPGGEGNRGLHVIHPDPGFGYRNGFAHNPSIGGHPALFVPDVEAVMARLDVAGILYSDAGVYAMPGMHQLYVYDPHANLIEINQHV